MKYILRFLIGCFVVLSAGIHAQTNSVDLLNGSSTLISSHSSITSAYAAIPSTLSQAYIIEVKTTYTGASETYPITFVNKTGASASNTITLRPEPSATNILVQSSVSGDPVLYLNNADFVIVDGRPGGSGGSIALTFNNLATNSSANTIELDFGASNNIIRNCSIDNSTTTSAGRNVAILGGSSDNLVTQCVVMAGRYAINVTGSTTANNTLQKNIIVDPIFAAVWVQSSAAGIIIDSNEIYSGSVVHDADYGVILFDAQSDTAVISRNWIHDLNTGTNTSATIGIQIRSSSSSSTDYILIKNNIIDLSSTTMSNSTNVIGIKYAGSGPFGTGIYFNTVRVGATLSSGGTSGNVVSACTQNIATSTSNVIDSKNNILVNNRSGGTSGVRHVCSDLANTNGTISGDYNVYNASSSEFATIGTTLFTSLSAYQTAVFPSEQNTNSQSITFVSSVDLHLNSTMLGNTNLTGTAITGITEDFDGELRILPYRGADELAQPCSGAPDAGTLALNFDTVCPNDTFILQLSAQTIASGLTYEWQSRPPSGSFATISGAVNANLFTSISSTTEFRCIVTCSNSGLSDVSDTLTMNLYQPVSVTSIGSTNTANSYTFVATGVSNATTYLWDFGDGDTSGSVSPTHIYSEPGLYEVSLVVSNPCDSDTVYLSITVDCFGAPQMGTVLAQPATICIGDTTLLTIVGLNTNAIPFYSFQWQRSVNGGAYTNVSGGNNDSLMAIPSQTVEYRCVVSCAASGDSTNTSSAEVIVEAPTIDSISATSISPFEFIFSVHGDTNITSYDWDFGDGSSQSTATANHQYGAPGIYSVTFTGTGSCGTISETLLVYVECVEPPVAGTISKTISKFTANFTQNTTSPNVSYLWRFGDGTTGTDSSITHVYGNDGTYTVVLIVENACGKDSTSIDIQIVIGGVDMLDSKASIQLYPNPTDNLTSIVSKRPLDDAQLVIRNVAGQLVYEDKYLSGNQIQLSAESLHLRTGTYFIEIVFPDSQYVNSWLVR